MDKAITIQRPIAQVYAFWRQLDNLPQFMRHVESVTVQDDLHSHWAVKTLAGKVVEWDSEIIEERENEMLSWRSVPGADVDNAGSVWFTPIPGDEGTVVRVELKYVPPAGKTGALVAKLFGRDAESEIEEDLLRLKSVLETGRPPENERTAIWPDRALERARQAAKATDACLRHHPWAAVASVAIGFFALGFLLGQRGRDTKPEEMHYDKNNPGNR